MKNAKAKALNQELDSWKGGKMPDFWVPPPFQLARTVLLTGAGVIGTMLGLVILVANFGPLLKGAYNLCRAAVWLVLGTLTPGSDHVDQDGLRQISEAISVSLLFFLVLVAGFLVWGVAHLAYRKIRAEIQIRGRNHQI